MKKDTNSSGLGILTPQRAASAKSARSSNQSLLTSNDFVTFQRQTIITPRGFRTMRIYGSPEKEKNALQKYKPRPKSALDGMMSKSASNNSLSPGDARLLKRASSANELNRRRSTEAKEERPNTASSSTSSSRNMIYNARHPSCLPPDLYRQDKLRAEARKNHPRSATHSCEECNSTGRHEATRRRRTRSAETADRYGTPVALPAFVKGNKFLTHEDLDMGQKQYIWGMARVYSTDQLKGLKQRQYQSILNYEYMKRVVSRGVEETDRVKLWKEYLEYQKVIDRIGKDGSVPKDKSLCEKYLKSHNHAKKHRITGWTTEFSDNESSIELDCSFGASSDHPSSAEEDRKNAYEDMDGRLSPVKSAKQRPKSSKFKARRTELSEADDLQQTRNIIEFNQQTDDSLSIEAQERLSIGDTEENYI